MPFNIESFRSQGLLKGGTRPSLFQVQLTTPPALDISNEAERRFTFTCEAASSPPLELGEVQVYHFGRPIKFHGDRTYPDWQVQVMNDEDFVVRAMFEKWNHSLNAAISNYRVADLENENDYKAILDVTQYGKNGDKIRAYQFVGAWAKIVGPMELSWESQNQIQKFGVVFSYDYWIPLFDGAATDTYQPINNGDVNLS